MQRAQQFLLLYSGVLTAAFVATVLFAFGPWRTESFRELTVERLNVVEPDGTLRMVISNHDMLPGIIVRGQERALDRPQGGMLFYNDEGSEIGGLIFGGHRNDKGAIVDSGVSLSFDKYESNQIVSLYGVEDSENRFAGLSVADSPSGSEVNRRIWLGRGEDGIATLALMDAKGNKRLLMQVEADGQAQFSILDEKGNVIQNLLPPAASE
ncbi:hypothetical protein [Pseudoxanthomonas spadix]|uniref:hypothetical protein n=1 Tax=Pseudoxanthomonas spadix TaxID=415229 RepID=UPI000EFF44B7|nr:hypothetical protein [Pseudoxanthomonas spadix]MBP3975892.1 hypothetical protein [Pseudoxanthomonas spadix]RMW93007.1 hypothetical protein D9R12_12450 [Pseudoxanthomonas spadix]